MYNNMLLFYDIRNKIGNILMKILLDDVRLDIFPSCISIDIEVVIGKEEKY